MFEFGGESGEGCDVVVLAVGQGFHVFFALLFVVEEFAEAGGDGVDLAGELVVFVDGEVAFGDLVVEGLVLAVELGGLSIDLAEVEFGGGAFAGVFVHEGAHFGDGTEVVLGFEVFVQGPENAGASEAFGFEELFGFEVGGCGRGCLGDYGSGDADESQSEITHTQHFHEYSRVWREGGSAL